MPLLNNEQLLLFGSRLPVLLLVYIVILRMQSDYDYRDEDGQRQADGYDFIQTHKTPHLL